MSLIDPQSNGDDLANPTFRWEIHREGGVVRVSLFGELDIATAETLEEALEEAEVDASVLVLDLQELGFIDSSGLRIIIRSNRRMQERGGRLFVGAASETVDRVLEVSGLHRYVEGIEGPARQTPRPRRPWE